MTTHAGTNGSLGRRHLLVPSARSACSLFRAGEKDMGDRRKLFNFVVPMYPTKWLTFKTVSDYMKEQERKGSGTAVAVWSLM